MNWKDDPNNPDVQNRIRASERLKLEQEKEDLKRLHENAYQAKLSDLVARHTLRYLPYRVTCPKEIRYPDLLDHMSNEILISLLQTLAQDSNEIKQILQKRLPELAITTKTLRY